MTRYWYDTEFIEDGRTIDLISIGIVSSDGREYYAQSVEFDPRKASKWVEDNVFPHLTLCPSHYRNPFLTSKTHHEALLNDWAYHNATKGQCLTGGAGPHCLWRSRKQLKNEVLAFVNAGEGTPELWAYYASYDHVAFCQLFGTMMDLPSNWPMYTRDLKQWCDMLGNPELPKQSETEHNALADARYNKAIWQFLNELQQEQ